jgi:Lanthionine synthetase C-like protein
MKIDLKYSLPEIKNFVVNHKKDDSFYLENQWKHLEKWTPTTANEALNESLLEYYVGIYLNQSERPLNLSFLEKRLYENTIEKIRNDQFGFMDGCGKGINYFLISENDQGQCVEKILEELFRSTHLEQFLQCNKDFQETDLSLSHGSTGVLLWLLRMIKRCKKDKRIYQYVQKLEPLFYHAIQCMLTHTLPVSIERKEHTFFPDYVKIQDAQTVYKIEDSHTWERGDLSKILLLYRAGLVFDNPHWLKLADNMGEFLSKIEIMPSTDFTIYKGTAGRALMYQKLYELTAKDIYQKAYIYWIEETYKNLLTNPFEKPKSLLFGELGAYLTLKSSIEGDFKWAEILLL